MRILLASVLVRLAVHVAMSNGAPVADDAWLATELDKANADLGPAGAKFTSESAASSAVPDTVVSRDDRDALAPASPDDGTVHVFVVEDLHDLDSDGLINGVTWRGGGARYLILAHGRARDDTLAHELGHFFGLSHTHDKTNLMTSPDRNADATLDRAQLRTIRRHLAAWAR